MLCCILVNSEDGEGDEVIVVHAVESEVSACLLHPLDLLQSIVMNVLVY
jgi:hypothetical protein